MARKARNPFLASVKACGGCVYFGFVTGDTGRMWCCDYTYKTGKMKPPNEPCAKCSVKILNIKGNAEMSEHCPTINQRFRRLGLSIGGMCQIMESRGRAARYMDVSAAFHGNPVMDESSLADILKTLDELEDEVRDQRRD